MLIHSTITAHGSRHIISYVRVVHILRTFPRLRKSHHKAEAWTWNGSEFRSRIFRGKSNDIICPLLCSQAQHHKPRKEKASFSFLLSLSSPNRQLGDKRQHTTQYAMHACDTYIQHAPTQREILETDGRPKPDWSISVFASPAQLPTANCHHQIQWTC